MLCQASVPHREQATVDRKQLSREIQQLRVELSQKNLKIDSIEAASQRKIAELEQRLGETLHHRQQLQVCVCVCVCVRACVCACVFNINTLCPKKMKSLLVLRVLITYLENVALFTSLHCCIFQTDNWQY